MLTQIMVFPKTSVNGVFRGQVEWVGVAHAVSPDAREGHPALRSLDAALALAILASLGQQRRSIGMGNPFLTHARMK
jgi:hypothetical protein